MSATRIPPSARVFLQLQSPPSFPQLRSPTQAVLECLRSRPPVCRFARCSSEVCRGTLGAVQEVLAAVRGRHRRDTSGWVHSLFAGLSRCGASPFPPTLHHDHCARFCTALALLPSTHNIRQGFFFCSVLHSRISRRLGIGHTGIPALECRLFFACSRACQSPPRLLCPYIVLGVVVGTESRRLGSTSLLQSWPTVPPLSGFNLMSRGLCAGGSCESMDNLSVVFSLGHG